MFDLVDTLTNALLHKHPLDMRDRVRDKVRDKVPDKARDKLLDKQLSGKLSGGLSGSWALKPVWRVVRGFVRGFVPGFWARKAVRGLSRAFGPSKEGCPSVCPETPILGPRCLEGCPGVCPGVVGVLSPFGPKM